MDIWHAQAEGKHKFFAWLLVESKLLTVDKLLKRNWPCNGHCVMCDQAPETEDHLCLHCPFAKEVWGHVRTWSGDLITIPDSSKGIEAWWNSELQGLPQNTRRVKAALMMYTAWNLWKERNRRIFEGKCVQPLRVLRFIIPLRVLRFIKDEMALRCRQPTGTCILVSMIRQLVGTCILISISLDWMKWPKQALCTSHYFGSL